MASMSIVYNLVMAALDAAALIWLTRQRSLWRCVGVAGMGGLAGVLLAVVLGEDCFGVFRLVAYALFVYEPVLLASSAMLLRPTRPRAALALALLALALVLVASYAFWVEPFWVEVTHVEVASPKLTGPVRIVVLADLQTDRLGAYEERVLRRVVAEKPDLVLLAGDYVHADTPAQVATLQMQLNTLLRQLEFAAPRGIFAVRGNVDGEGWERVFAGLPITVVQATQTFDVGAIRLTCLGMRDSFDPNFQLGNQDCRTYHIVLGHSPDYALGRVEADLLVAGHTHGGQVRLPLVGPLMTGSRVPRSWASGCRVLPEGRLLVVSRGIGMEREFAPRLRFLCRPQLVVLDLKPAR